MADSAKREKIAAARKKLKQFKQKAGRNSPATKLPQNSNDNSTKPSSAGTTSNSEEHAVKNKEMNSVVNNGEDIRPESPSDESSIKTKTARLNSPLTEESTPPVEPLSNTERTSSSTESLHQLSRQINGLLSESSALVDGEDGENSDVVELERRNRELAALLEKHSQANDQLNTQIVQVREYAKTLQDQLEKERNLFSDKQKQEVGPLKEQLQATCRHVMRQCSNVICMKQKLELAVGELNIFTLNQIHVHIQTIGILVAEKTELQSQLSQCQKIAEQRFDEIDELSGRLKASRQRVSDLERNLSTTNNSSQQFQKNSKDLAKDVDRLKLELYKSNKSQEELKQQNTELGEKLQAKTSECVGLEQSLEDLKRKVEMAELYAQQLSSHSDSSQESLKIVEELQRDKTQLEAKVQEFNEAFQRISAERDQISEQYQHYIDQLQHQCQDSTQQITFLTEEREKLVRRQHELEGAVLELQRKLEDVDIQNQSTDDAVNPEIATELENVKKEYDELLQRHEAQIRDNAQLSRFLEEKEDRITELENTVSEYGKEEGDRAQLLENLQSDKTALSRALTQNKDLKTQLAELQNGFVKMSNDNMEMMTKLQAEQHNSSELACRLGQQEDELKKTREALTHREELLAEMEQYSHAEKKEIHQQEQIQDRLRHYEAQAQLTETLQRELQNSQDMVDALTTQNSELRTMLIKMSDNKSQEKETTENGENRDDVIDSLTTAIKQLEVERNQLVQNLKDQRELSDSLSVKVADMEEELTQTNADFKSSDNDRITKKEYDQLKNAMDLIQEKYTRVMKDKADLTDKAEELEHIVLQLQGETDTIGEYISLYHHQRALLQQRELQKNEYIAHLARDREQLQGKLGELQVLVMQLLGEKNMLHNYNEESQLHSPDVSIQPHLAKQTETQLTNGLSNQQTLDWPDYTSSESDTESEVETIIGGKTHLDNSQTDFIQENHVNHFEHVPRERTHSQRTSDSYEDHVHHEGHTAYYEGHHVHHEGHKGHYHEGHVHEGQTAHKILNLLSEIGHSNLVDTIVDHNFLPCKYCKGQVQIV